MILKIVEILAPQEAPKLPLLSSPIRAGDLSFGYDYIEDEIDLNEFLIRYPEATYLIKVEGSSMEQEGIFSGDILVVDRARKPHLDNLVVKASNENLAIKKIRSKKDIDSSTWGVITYVIHKL